MIRKLLMISACVLLVGCSGKPSLDPSQAPPPPTSSLLQTVISDIRLGCNIVIGVTDIQGIDALIASVPFGSSAESIAKLACNAFRAIAGSKRGLGGSIAATVNGVRITGHYAMGRKK